MNDERYSDRRLVLFSRRQKDWPRIVDDCHEAEGHDQQGYHLSTAIPYSYTRSDYIITYQRFQEMIQDCKTTRDKTEG